MKRYNSTTPRDLSSETDRLLPAGESAEAERDQAVLPPEVGGRRKGLEPTRYGDWEKDGRCIDF